MVLPENSLLFVDNFVKYSSSSYELSAASQYYSQFACAVEGVRMVDAESPTVTGEGVLTEGSGSGVVAQCVKGGSQASGDAECVGVVVAEDPAQAGEGIFFECA